MLELCLSSSPNHRAQPTGECSSYQPGCTTRHTRRRVSATRIAVIGTNTAVKIAASRKIPTKELWKVGRSLPSRASTPTAGAIAAAASASSNPRLAPNSHAHPRARPGVGACAGQLSPATPVRRAGAPPQRSPAGISPDTTVPISISAPSPMTDPGFSREREPIRAPAPIRISPTTRSWPSIHQPRRSTLDSMVAPSPMCRSAPAGGTVASRAPSPTSAPTSRA